MFGTEFSFVTHIHEDGRMVSKPKYSVSEVIFEYIEIYQDTKVIFSD